MYGCDKFGYPVLRQGSGCVDPQAFGWISAGVFLIIFVFGRYVLPTVLIGIVVISFDQATTAATQLEENYHKVDAIIIKAKDKMPEFFTEKRIEKMRLVFDQVDTDGKGSLDNIEIMPFYEYVFARSLGIRLTHDQQEMVFQLMDVDGDGELGFAEFVSFLLVVKGIDGSDGSAPLLPPSGSASTPATEPTKSPFRATAAQGGWTNDNERRNSGDSEQPLAATHSKERGGFGGNFFSFSAPSSRVQPIDSSEVNAQAAPVSSIEINKLPRTKRTQETSLFYEDPVQLLRVEASFDAAS